MDSPLLLWMHFAPVCGTASRAREIRVHWSDPRPLRSNELPRGLPSLSGNDKQRVLIANDLFEYTCKLFKKAVQAGILATVENPKNSYFWVTEWFLQLMKTCRLFVADFHVCMLGGTRNKWTLWRISKKFSSSAYSVTSLMTTSPGASPKIRKESKSGPQAWNQHILGRCV
ncbi:unnamed protein product [Durusdinium trenchii]|uniref:Uncharacterized protein n=1 Tax=Durusdinium trenchii TaxID=1381693 RepID=A0ABP0Q9S1_9DINO